MANPSTPDNAVGVDRVVLEHEQGVEQLVVTGDAVNVAQRQMLVLERVVVGALQLLEQVCGGGCRRDASPAPAPC